MRSPSGDHAKSSTPPTWLSGCRLMRQGGSPLLGSELEASELFTRRKVASASSGSSMKARSKIGCFSEPASPPSGSGTPASGSLAPLPAAPPLPEEPPTAVEPPAPPLPDEPAVASDADASGPSDVEPPCECSTSTSPSSPSSTSIIRLQALCSAATPRIQECCTLNHPFGWGRPGWGAAACLERNDA